MLYLFNTTILTTPGLSYDSEIISVERARQLVQHWWATPKRADEVSPTPHWRSAIGHEATAAIASTILGVGVPMSREVVRMQPGDIAICIKLRGRPPEGAILSREEVEVIGYDLVLLTARDPADRREFAETMTKAAAMLCYPDAPTHGEQPCASRRQGNYPMQAHFIVRLPERDGGRYYSVTQEWGTDAWDVRTISAHEAEAQTHRPTPVTDDRMDLLTRP